MDRVKELAAESAKATKALEKELAELDRLKKLLENLNKRYEVAMAERQRLQDETDLLERRLIAADKLIKYIIQRNNFDFILRKIIHQKLY